jgi:hypothetical protein
MLRFILNFIIFGMIFYLIWKFQPTWIDVMRSWADSAYDIIVNLANMGIERIKEISSSGNAGNKG